MNKIKVYSYITALGVALVTTEFGNRLGDCITKKFGSSWGLLIATIITMAIFILGYFLINRIDKIFLEKAKEDSENELTSIKFYLIFAIVSFLIVLAQATTNLLK